MKTWLAIAGLLLFLALPGILAYVPWPTGPVKPQGPVAASAPVPGATTQQAPTPSATPTQAGPLTATQREEVFLAMWETVDTEYLYLDRRDVNWNAVREKYLPAARDAADDWAFRLVLRQALAELKDPHTVLRSAPGTSAAPHIWVEPDGDQIVITHVDPGSDAAQASLKPGMVLLEIDGLPLAEAWAYSATLRTGATPAAGKWRSGADILYGQTGSVVKVVAAFPKEEPIRATLVRSSTSSPHSRAVEQKMLQGDIAYVSIPNMKESVVFRDAEAALRTIVETKPPGLIIDVRYNTGGLPEHVYDLSNFLFRKGTILAREAWHNTGTQVPIISLLGDAPYQGPIVLLTNPGCISACDLFAKILQQDGRAILVGMPPAGATIAPLEKTLPYGFSIAMSMYWEMLDGYGKPIEQHPAPVDYEVTPTANDWATGRDPALEKAIELLQAQNP